MLPLWLSFTKTPLRAAKPDASSTHLGDKRRAARTSASGRQTTSAFANSLATLDVRGRCVKLFAGASRARDRRHDVSAFRAMNFQ
jgi:hypothetical protein